MPAALSVNAELLPDLADLLEYPGEGYIDLVRRTSGKVRPWCSLEAAEALDNFVAEISTKEIDELEELHTRTFSLAPICVPYIGVQIFGENNFKRGDLIAGFARELEKHRLDVRPELPDHLACVLRLAACLPPDERDELFAWCLCIAVERMAQQIQSSSSPYKHLISAIHLFLTRQKKEAVTCV